MKLDLMGPVRLFLRFTYLSRSTLRIVLDCCLSRVMSESCYEDINRQNKILMTNGSLMKVESIAECSLGAFCNTFDLH